ncbi:MAG: hypothetical protein U0586_14605 [Candidatus Brocadiaceae bacterium]
MTSGDACPAKYVIGRSTVVKVILLQKISKYASLLNTSGHSKKVVVIKYGHPE